MTDWLDDLFKKVDRQGDSRRSERDWQIRCDAIISTQSSDSFGKLHRKLQESVERINKRYANSASRQLEFYASGENDFWIQTRYYPRLAVYVHLNPKIQGIECRFISTADRASGGKEERKELLRFAVNESSTICIEHDRVRKTTDELSELLLAPLMLR